MGKFKVDGHTHTQFCPHGSGDYVQDMIEKAISLGFVEYHITEHTPVPKSFFDLLEPKEKLLHDLHMPESEVDRYIREMLEVKRVYKDKIDVKVGFEVDFLPTDTNWTKNFLNEYGKYCDTGVLSVHFMQGSIDWRCVDFDPEDVRQNLLPVFGTLENLYLNYYDLVIESINSDLGKYKPTRLGHLTLVNKFQKALGVVESGKVDQKTEDILQLLRQKNYSLDYNHAGLYKPFCAQTYPPRHIAQKAQLYGIGLVYGSDAHSVADIKQY